MQPLMARFPEIIRKTQAAFGRCRNPQSPPPRDCLTVSFAIAELLADFDPAAHAGVR